MCLASTHQISIAICFFPFQQIDIPFVHFTYPSLQAFDHLVIFFSNNIRGQNIIHMAADYMNIMFFNFNFLMIVLDQRRTIIRIKEAKNSKKGERSTPEQPQQHKNKSKNKISTR